MNKLELTDEQLLLVERALDFYSRVGIGGNSPYGNKRILNAMSDKFDMNYDKLSDEIKKMFKEEKI